MASGAENAVAVPNDDFTETNGTFTNKLEEVIATGDTVVAIGQIHAERKGKSIDSKQVAVYRAAPDGKVTEATFYSDDTSQFDAFYS